MIIDKLKTAAERSASKKEAWFTPKGLRCTFEFEEDREFIAEATPELILALLREREIYREALGFYSLFNPSKVSGESYTIMAREALKQGDALWAELEKD